MGIGPQEMAERRHAKAGAAMRALNVKDWEWLDLPEGEWDMETGPAVGSGIGAVLS